MEPEHPGCLADAVATMRILALVPLAAAFAPPPAAPRRARQILRAEPLTQEQRNVVETFREGMERHPTMVKSVAARTKELLEDERDNLDDDSLPAKFDRFFNGLVRHPAMLWGTFLRVAELMEEELIEAFKVTIKHWRIKNFTKRTSCSTLFSLRLQVTSFIFGSLEAQMGVTCSRNFDHLR